MDDIPDSVVIENLREAGSDLSKPHDIEFAMYVRERAGAERIEAQLKAQGFDVHVEHDDEEQDWGITAMRRKVHPRKENAIAMRIAMAFY